MVIGIDIGGSTTKIIGIEKTQPIGLAYAPLLVRATDPVASLFGAFGKFIDENGLTLAHVEKVVITGVGASHISRPIYGIETERVNEFLAIGRGGLVLSGLSEAIIVSMGTGTAIVGALADGSVSHMGGTGVGGGTILGLASRLLGVQNIETLIEMAERGDLRNVNLTVSDISKEALSNLAPNITASNFGKLSDTATQEDIAMGIFNMVLESIGALARFAMLRSGLENIVLTGNLSTLNVCKKTFAQFSSLFGVNITIPNHSEFATALGAALTAT